LDIIILRSAWFKFAKPQEVIETAADIEALADKL
jgi:hypothetical protein